MNQPTKSPAMRFVPIFRPEAKHLFVDVDLVKPTEITLAGETVLTAPLKFGKKFSLLGLSQTSALLDAGIVDETDCLDPAIVLKNLYISHKNNKQAVTVHQVDNMPYATGVADTKGNYRQVTLNFNAILQTPGQDEGSVIFFKVMVSGTVNLETAETLLVGSVGDAGKVINAKGQTVSMASEEARRITEGFEHCELISYDLLFSRVNSNKSQRCHIPHHPV
jgi:hypothetical protein